MNAFKTTRALLSRSWLVFCLAFASGCQNGPMAGRMQQYQLENERLLSEFRSQKKENEQLRSDRTRLLQQQADHTFKTFKMDTDMGQAGGGSVADLDADGFADVAFSSYEQDVVKIYSAS